MRRVWLIFCQLFTLITALTLVVRAVLPGSTEYAPGPGSPVSFRLAASMAGPSVVSLCRADTRQHCFGSGIVVDEAGYILTNEHLVDTAGIEARLADGRRASAGVVATDTESDLAILKISLSRLPVITPGNENALAPGDPVLVIGNPQGEGLSTTPGMVSALGRSRDDGHLVPLIEIGAQIFPGNSGGALVDVNGRLVGIVSAYHGQRSGTGYAIPVSQAWDVMMQLLEHGSVVRGWIGVDAVLQDGLVTVAEVRKGGPADQAGLLPSDVITAIEGQPVQNIPLYLRMVAALLPGQPAAFTVKREQATMQFRIVPVARPASRL